MKKKKAEKNNDKDGKPLYKLMNNGICGKLWKKVFNLVGIRKSKLALKLKKDLMCISESSKILMYEFYFDYIKTKYGNKSKLLFTDNGGLMYEIKTEDV